MTSVEFLEEGASEWAEGRDLPLGISSGMAVTDSDDGAILVGGMSSAGLLNKLYQLVDTDSAWTEMAQQLQVARRWGTAFLVPDDIAQCN